MIKNKTRAKTYINPYHGRAYLSIGNNSVSVTRLEYFSKKISNDLSGFKIVHISDLHNKEYGEGQYRLIDRIKEQRPDMITIAGDLIDKRRIDIDVAMSFIRGAVNIAPVYYVSGNHEIESGKYNDLCTKIKAFGAACMDNGSRTIKYGGSEFSLSGLRDASSFCTDPCVVDDPVKEKIKTALGSLFGSGSSRFSVLLTHRPEFIDIYSECGADLVLSGHAHGGQVRLPFAGGLYAPGQGILPRYTSGMYVCGKTCLVVSRGLGNSLFPLRIFNPPEIVAITLKKQP